MKPAVLIVRPPPQAAADAAALADSAWLPVPFSPMELQADTDALGRLNARIQQADAVFWVSPGAVQTAAPVVDFSDGRIRHITVGTAGQRSLAAFCPHPVLCPENGNDSEAVLQLPLWRQLPPASRILVVRGQGGRDYLARQLAARGLHVETAEVYRRRPLEPDWSVFKRFPVRAAYITSAELVRLLFGQVPSGLVQTLQSLLYFTHHPRIAQALQQAGVRRIRQIHDLAQALSAPPTTIDTESNR